MFSFNKQKVALLGFNLGMKRYAKRFSVYFQLKCIENFKESKEWLADFLLITKIPWILF